MDRMERMVDPMVAEAEAVAVVVGMEYDGRFSGACL